MNTAQKFELIKSLALKMGWLIKYINNDTTSARALRFNFVDYNRLQKVLLKRVDIDEASLQTPVSWQLSEMCFGLSPRVGNQFDLEYDYLKDDLSVHDGFSDFFTGEGADLEFATLLDGLLADLSEDQIRTAFAAHEEQFFLLGRTSTWDNPNAVPLIPGHLHRLHGGYYDSQRGVDVRLL